MKKTFLLLLLSVQFTICFSQSFICTDFYAKSTRFTPNDIQEERNRTLGTKATLTIYDKTLKFVSYKENGEKHRPIVYDKAKDGNYQYKKNSSFSYVIKLNKILGYIKSFKVIVYEDGKESGYIIYKRE